MSEFEHQPMVETSEDWLRAWTQGIAKSLGKNKLEALWVWRLTRGGNLERINECTKSYNWSLKSKDPIYIQRCWIKLLLAWRMAELRISKLMEYPAEYQKHLQEYLQETTFVELEKSLPWFGYDINGILNGEDLSLVHEPSGFLEAMKKLEENEKIRFQRDPGSLAPFIDTLLGELPDSIEDVNRCWGHNNVPQDPDQNEELPF